MSVQVRFFASLSEQLGVREKQVSHKSQMTIADLWQQVADRPPPDNLLCALNHEYAETGQLVSDGDEVAFFPPVNGG